MELSVSTLAIVTVTVLLAMNVVVWFPEVVFGPQVVAQVDAKARMRRPPKLDSPNSELGGSSEDVKPLAETFGGRGLTVERLQKSFHYMRDPDEWGTRHEHGRWLLIKCRDWTGPMRCPFVRKLLTQLLSSEVTDIRVLLLPVMGPDAAAVLPWVDEHKDWFDPRNGVPSSALLLDGVPLKHRLGPFVDSTEAQLWLHEENGSE